MQQTGTLKKRRRRNLSKVTGVSTILYNEVEDNLDGKGFFTPKSDVDNLHVAAEGGGGRRDTRVRMSTLFQDINSSRVTRDPTFHMEPDEDSDYEDFQSGISQIRTVQSYGTVGERDVMKIRPYFLDKWTIARLRQIILLGICSETFPWKWNAKNHRIEKWNSSLEKWWNIQWFLLTIQTSLLTIFQFYALLKAITLGQHETYRELFMSSISVFWYVFAVIFNINMSIYKDRIRQYINTLFKFNRDFMEKYVVNLDGYKDGGRIVINLSIPSNTFQVFVTTSLFLVMLFQPWYLFSYIYPKPWYWLIPGALHEFVLVGQVLTNYILYQWIVVAHTNSMEFWLREIHKSNESGYTIDELRNPKTAVETYRTLQIMYTCFNECMAPLAIPMMKLHIFFALIPCGFIFVRSLNHIFIKEFPGILLYPVGIIDCATTGFCTMSLSATVFDLGCGFVDSWSRTKHKDFRRILMSCPTLKVKVARFYFITVATTITFFKSVIDYITDCIITFP